MSTTAIAILAATFGAMCSDRCGILSSALGGATLWAGLKVLCRTGLNSLNWQSLS